MADRAGSVVAAAQAIAKERRNQSGSSPLLPPPSSNTRSTFKPVIDGSVLKNDIKQKLAKERREEMRRQQDANKEMQLLEKERKAKIQYVKQMEEKQRKLREHREKYEQRRIAAEQKRKQKSQEEREKWNAVLSRISETSNTVGQRTKRCPWQSSVAATSENKTVMKRSGSSEKLKQEASASDKQRTVSSSGLQSAVSKKKRTNLLLHRRKSKQHSPMGTEPVEKGSGAQLLYVDFRENDLLLRLTAPPKASIAKSRGAASLPFPGKGSTAGIHNPIIQYINTPSLSHNSDEMKKTTVSQKSTVAVSLPERVETPLKVSLEKPLSPSVGVAPRLNEKMFPENVEASLEGSDHESHVSVDPTLEASTDLSCDSMDPSSEGGMDSVAKVSMEVSSPEASVDVFQEPSKEAFYEVNMETVPEESTEMSPVESVKVSPKLSPESPCDVSVETSPEVKMRDSPQSSEMGIEASSSLTKNQPSSQILRCISSTSAYGWFTPSLVFAKQNQKNQSLSFSSVMPKQSTAYFLSRKTTPVQSTMFERSAVGIGREKNEAAAKTAESSDAVNQKHVACDEFGKKSTPGTMSAKETTKILADKGCLAGEQREKEERLQKEMEQRKEKDTAKKVAEDQEEEFSKLDDGQQLKGIEKKTERPDQDDKNVLQQRGDAKIKAQEDAEKRQKERQQIFQNLKERMERRKRILEIIKERRQTDSNASKVMETLSKDICEENKADNEDQSESDNKDSYHN